MTEKCGSLTRSADCSHSTIHMGHSGKLCQRKCLTGNWWKYSEPQTIWRTGSTQFWETWSSSCFGKSPNFVQSYLDKFHRKICQGFMMANRVLYFLTQIINLLLDSSPICSRKSISTSKAQNYRKLFKSTVPKLWEFTIKYMEKGQIIAWKDLKHPNTKCRALKECFSPLHAPFSVLTK